MRGLVPRRRLGRLAWVACGVPLVVFAASACRQAPVPAGVGRNEAAAVRGRPPVAPLRPVASSPAARPASDPPAGASLPAPTPSFVPAAPPPSPHAAAAPPAIIEVDWPAADASDASGSPQALQLFPDDDSRSALDCPEMRARSGPADARQHRCALGPTASLRIGDASYWLALAVEHSEWDGMYGVREDVVLLDPSSVPPRVVHTIVQWHKSVVDCRTTLELRRLALADLDGDGREELCIETVQEVGLGLFEVMKQTESDRDWVPFVRRRTFAAFAVEPGSSRLARRPSLERGCTDRHYRPFVPVPLDAVDRLDRRRGLQGKQPVLPCVPPWTELGCDPDESCPGVHVAARDP